MVFVLSREQEVQHVLPRRETPTCFTCGSLLFSSELTVEPELFLSSCTAVRWVLCVTAAVSALKHWTSRFLWWEKKSRTWGIFITSPVVNAAETDVTAACFSVKCHLSSSVDVQKCLDNILFVFLLSHLLAPALLFTGRCWAVQSDLIANTWCPSSLLCQRLDSVNLIRRLHRLHLRPHRRL